MTPDRGGQPRNIDDVVEEALDELVEEGMIEPRVDPETGKRYYRITDAGRELREELRDE